MTKHLLSQHRKLRAWWVGESVELLDVQAELAGAGAERKDG